MTILSGDPSTSAAVTDGSSEAAVSSLIVSVDPATGAETGRVNSATADDVAAAVAAARAALPAWRATSPGARGAALRAAAADLRADLEAIADLHTRDTGRLLADARGAVEVAASLLEEAATVVPLDAGRSLGGDPRALDVVRREPRGVVAVITPWNDPVPAAAGLLGAALATGNTVVHKPSERSPLVGAALAEVLRRHLPDGVLTLVQGDGAVGEHLVGEPRRRRRRARGLDPRRPADRGGGRPPGGEAAAGERRQGRSRRRRGRRPGVGGPAGGARARSSTPASSA